MTWSDVYLVCFLVGLTLSLASVLTGSGHVHLPHVHVAHGPHVHAAHGKSGLAPLNFGTLTAFLAWFGGAGFLLTRYYGIWPWLGLAAAVVAGIAGAAAVFWFVTTVLVSPEENLDPADYEMVGVHGRLTSSIGAGGTGELVYSQQGTRRTTCARSAEGDAIAKGTEVIVMRYERGIAYVRPWDDDVALSNASNQRVGR